MPEIFTDRTDPEILFVNCGHGRYRSILDNKNFNFISAGHGNRENRDEFYFSNQIRRLIIGDIICVYRNGIGYVGIAKVVSKPMTISNAYLRDQKVTKEMFSKEANIFDKDNEPGYAECLVEIEWLTTVHTDNTPKSGECYGRPYFSNQNTVCSMFKQQATIKALEAAFKLEFTQHLPKN